jgi:hypothetical protein
MGAAVARAARPRSGPERVAQVLPAGGGRRKPPTDSPDPRPFLREAPGRQQREVVSAIERAIRAVKRGDVPAIRTAAAAIAQLDAAHVYPDVPAALLALADGQNSAADVTQPFTRLRAALGPGPLAAELEDVSPSGDGPDRGPGG